MDKSVKAVEDALKDGKQIHASPETMKTMREKGLPVPDLDEIIPWEDYVEKLFGHDKKEKALNRVKKLPQLANIPVPAITNIYKEILKCIAHGLNGAAITLSCVLLDHMLKYSIFKVEMNGFVTYDQEKWDQIEGLAFGDAIGRAASCKLITKEERKALHEFREKVRNPYLHYNLLNIVKDVTAHNIQTLEISSGNVTTSTISAADDPTIQPSAKAFVDEKNLPLIFSFVNEFVAKLWKKIEPLSKSS